MSAPLVPDVILGNISCTLAKLGTVVFRLAEDQLAAIGLRVRHYMILKALAELGARPQLDLGTYLRIDPATMVSSLDDLEQRGLAERRRDPADRRRYLIGITDAGRDVVAQGDELVRKADALLLGSIDGTQFRAALREIAVNPDLAASFDAIKGS